MRQLSIHGFSEELQVQHTPLAVPQVEWRRIGANPRQELWIRVLLVFQALESSGKIGPAGTFVIS